MNRRLAVLAQSAADTSIGGPQSVLTPAGEESRIVSGVWWLYFWISVAVFVLVLLFLTLGAVRSRRSESDAPDLHPDPARERTAAMFAGGAVAATVLLLGVLLASELWAGRALASQEENAPDAMTVRITGNQWWWDVEYVGNQPSETFRTANEVHVPVGRPVRFLLRSNDVIHSFWVPNLAGKRDLIPGKEVSLVSRATAAGSFTGQCAEYCGQQHAHMRLTVTSEQESEYEAWAAAQRAPAAEPTSESALRGKRAFLTGTCVMCHTVTGTPANSRVGPDLTHIASRPSIAGGTLKNTRGNLAGWLVSPQHLKPGVRMPDQALKASDLNDMLDYLGGLK